MGMCWEVRLLRRQRQRRNALSALLPTRLNKRRGMGCSRRQRIDFREIVPPPIAATAMKALFRGASKQRELKA